MQIRRRLTIQFILIVAIIMVFALVFIHLEFKNQIRDDFYSSLKSKAIMTADMIVGQTIRYTDSSQEFSQIPELPVYTENITIYNQENQRIYSFNPAPNNLSESTINEIRNSGESRFTKNHYDALGLIYKDKKNIPYVVVAEAVFKPEHLSDLNNILMIVFILFILFVAVGGWIFAGQALEPVNQIMNQVDEILPTDMSHRLKAFNQNDELSRLVITFNKLLDRIQKAFTTQKLFLSNISHELKNPLSVIISQIEVALQKDRTEYQYKETLASVLDDVKNLDEVSNKLMQLARINSDNDVIDFQNIRIDELLWQVKANLIKSHPEYKIYFEILNLPEDEGSLQIKANEHLIKTALLNLMDNGCKYSPDHRVQLRLSYSNSIGVQLEIEDNGPGIRDEDMPYIFEPFYRSPKTAAIRGSGIGLSLVSSILKIHKINLEVTRPVKQGTIFKLIFNDFAHVKKDSTYQESKRNKDTVPDLQFN
ncbi:MAG: HAMP domain-containing sensor histidine kinase [Saprospiraceae bacterium]